LVRAIVLRLRDKRRAFQIISLAISNLGFIRILKTGFVCPFLYCRGCPFAAFSCPIGIIQNFIIYGRPPLFTIGLLGVYGTIFGRALCGWACPFGALQDLISHFRHGRNLKVRPVWYTKFIVLILSLAAAWYFLDTAFCKLCPSGSLFGAIIFHIINPAYISALSPYFYIHIFTLALTILLAALISRFWCRYLCPLGAISGMFNRISIISINLDPERCLRCNDCLESCIMGISRVEDIGRSIDCILCGRCIASCGSKALKYAPNVRG